MDGSSGQDAVIARLEAKVAELEATVARLDGADQIDHDVPAWGTPSRRPVEGPDQVADAVDGSQVAGGVRTWGTPEPHGRNGAPAPHVDHDDTMATAEQVGEVCRHIASGTWTADSPPVWLGSRAWHVLDVVDSRALLLADQVVDRREYHEKPSSVTWENCDLRRWLNGEFCVSLGEPLLSRALTMKVSNKPNPVWCADGGRDTKDRFFLLSISEAAVHFTGRESRSEARRLGNAGIALDGQGVRAWWWLRSPGFCSVDAASVDTDGHLEDRGRLVCSVGGVRPAFWLDLRS